MKKHLTKQQAWRTIAAEYEVVLGPMTLRAYDHETHGEGLAYTGFCNAICVLWEGRRITLQTRLRMHREVREMLRLRQEVEPAADGFDHVTVEEYTEAGAGLRVMLALLAAYGAFARD